MGKKRTLSPLCSKCKNEKELTTKRYCRKCTAEYLREWRKTHPLTDEQKFKANVRSNTKMKLRRGTLLRLPCQICGDEKSEAHHLDYLKPDLIEWLCLKHHRERHKKDE
jgi:hypothetical protein